MLNQRPELIDGKLPVFVFPSSLTFYSDDQSSHKQILTLYNPYEFPLKFKILSTSPRKYTVVDSEGTIKQRCRVDIVIRHIDICIDNEGVKDKMRIQVVEHGQRKILGYKDVQCILLPRRESARLQEDTFLSLPKQSTPELQGSQPSLRTGRTEGPTSTASGPSLIVILTAVSCIIALMLPSQGESDSRVPEYLHLSLHQKLIAAYILGLVTMVILHI